MDKKDLRGIVTIVMLAIFFLAVFVPVVSQAVGKDVLILEQYTQAIIQLTTMVVAFYFTNKATRDRSE